MNLVCIAEHTIDVDRLTKGGFVLDAGCRNFAFAKDLQARGCNVLAVDADPTIEAPKDFKGVFSQVALATEAGERNFLMHANPEARHLIRDGVFSFPTTKVNAITIADLMEFYEIKHWDVVKLDIEGAEYDILQAWPGPTATQISIEFHEHCGPRPPSVYDAILKHLGQWYDVVRHVSETKHCAGYNYWDSLMIMKNAS